MYYIHDDFLPEPEARRQFTPEPDLSDYDDYDRDFTEFMEDERDMELIAYYDPEPESQREFDDWVESHDITID